MRVDIRASQFDHRRFLRTLTGEPGVYRMLDEENNYLYVGKAKHLNRRVASYFRRGGFNARIQTMLMATAAIEVTVTRNEAEALLLENNLIKQHRPRYNVLLRDDKSYPYIYLQADHRFPRLMFYRGARKKSGRLFGPYASAGAVRDSLNFLEKTFRLRNCEESVFRNRTRPCLQFQIKRCTAPCVGYIDSVSYAEDVEQAVKFLEGRGGEVITSLVSRMDQASQALEFERAAALRDRIEALRRISEKQYVSTDREDLDVIACHWAHGAGCVLVVNIRGGLSLGDKSFFPHSQGEIGEAALLTAFVGQYYLNHDVPPEILLSTKPKDMSTLEEMLRLRRGKDVQLIHSVRGTRARWLDMARRNAEQALLARRLTRESTRKRAEQLRELLGLDSVPERMECFDISHTMGEATVASCVVFDSEGPVKAQYRRFNIEGITPGDDYAAMHQALLRRFKRFVQGEGVLPDVLFIDGGKGQTAQADAVLTELGITGVTVVGVAKGPDRKPGLEELVLSGTGATSILPPDSPALHLVQQIRDEAHRFAITGHRKRRANSRNRSPLENVDGLGPKRRQSLMKHFGGLKGLSRAGVEELATVPGISLALAQRIYDLLHATT